MKVNKVVEGNFVHKGLLRIVISYILSNSGSIDDAMEIYQESIVIFEEKISKGFTIDEAAKSSYIWSIAKRQWLKELKRRKKFSPITRDVVDKSSWLLQQKERDEELIGLINDCIKKLDKKYQRALELRYSGWSISQICDILKLENEQSGKDLVYRAKKKLLRICVEDPRYERIKEDI